jgi:adenylosuccinate synthase
MFSIINFLKANYMNYAVIGTQWGDEGKGKIVDYLTSKNSIKAVVRYQGGNNAGHTVVVKDKKYPLHLLPSGILHETKTCVIGNGVIVNPEILLEELNNLKDLKIAKLLISDKANLIMPWHIVIDSIKNGAFGSTCRGIGPTYSAFYDRHGIRFSDLDTKKRFENRVDEELRWHLQHIALLMDYHKVKAEQSSKLDCDHCLDKNYIVRTYWNALQKIKKHPRVKIVNTAQYLNNLQDNKSSILFEGAQATLLDIAHGTYPFVTSSYPTIGGIYTGTGFRPKNIKVIGVVKAYTTRVGTGPFPTELENKTGEKLRETGHEFGTTTGRPRRCGWLDLPIINYAKLTNGLDEIALTKIDVLSGIKKIKVATHYEIDGKKTNIFETDPERLSKAKIIYKELEGWNQDITKAKKFSDLPKNAQKYIEFIEKNTKLPIKSIGVGPNRSQLILR